MLLCLLVCNSQNQRRDVSTDGSMLSEYASEYIEFASIDANAIFIHDLMGDPNWFEANLQLSSLKG